jgi:hypothetical protein
VPGDIEPGTRILGFTPLLPVDAERCRFNIAMNIGLDLPEAMERRKLDIVANGPSAMAYFFRQTDSLSPSDAPSLALNGVLRTFLEHGLCPTYWAACDPQELVADFLPRDPPHDITYFVASKCHPRVFEKLRGRNVVLWHVKDHPAEGRLRIAPSCSVTMTAAWLFVRRGFTDLDFWGWDGCWIGDEHHAGDGGVGEELVNVNFGGKVENGEIVGGRTFKTSASWSAEYLAAEQFFNLADYLDLNIAVHGDGMMKEAYEEVRKEREACSQSS